MIIHQEILNSSFHLRGDILNLLFLHDTLPCIVYLRFDKAAYISLLFQSIFSVRLNNSL